MVNATNNTISTFAGTFSEKVLDLKVKEVDFFKKVEIVDIKTSDDIPKVIISKGEDKEDDQYIILTKVKDVDLFNTVFEEEVSALKQECHNQPKIGTHQEEDDDKAAQDNNKNTAIPLFEDVGLSNFKAVKRTLRNAHDQSLDSSAGQNQFLSKSSHVLDVNATSMEHGHVPATNTNPFLEKVQDLEVNENLEVDTVDNSFSKVDYSEEEEENQEQRDQDDGGLIGNRSFFTEDEEVLVSGTMVQWYKEVLPVPFSFEEQIQEQITEDDMDSISITNSEVVDFAQNKVNSSDSSVSNCVVHKKHQHEKLITKEEVDASITKFRDSYTKLDPILEITSTESGDKAQNQVLTKDPNCPHSSRKSLDLSSDEILFQNKDFPHSSSQMADELGVLDNSQCGNVKKLHTGDECSWEDVPIWSSKEYLDLNTQEAEVARKLKHQEPPVKLRRQKVRYQEVSHV